MNSVHCIHYPMHSFIPYNTAQLAVSFTQQNKYIHYCSKSKRTDFNFSDAFMIFADISLHFWTQLKLLDKIFLRLGISTNVVLKK